MIDALDGWDALTESESDSAVNEFAQTCWNFGNQQDDDRNINLGAFGELVFPLYFGGSQKILVRDCYKTLFERTLEYARSSPTSGLVVTGQPGTGKTYYLFYLLVRLLRTHATVAFHFISETYLFYPDEHLGRYQIFTPSRTPKTRLPRPRQNDKLIWTLMEVYPGAPAPPFLYGYGDSFLVQTPSPNPALYKEWRKQRIGVIWGMDLWTHDELFEGLRLHKYYPDFEEKLKRLLLDESSGEDVEAEMILKRHIQNTLDPSDSATLLPATSSTTPLAHKNAGPIASPMKASPVRKSNSLAISLDDALRVLIDDAVRLYGPIPREVFYAVLRDRDFNLMFQDNKLAQLDLRALKQIVNEAQDSNLVAILGSHLVIRIQPIQSPRLSSSCSWTTTFKSDWVAKRAFDQLKNLTLSALREQFLLYNGVSTTTTLAGHLFEITSHRLLCLGEFDYHYYKMKAANKDGPPKFGSAPYSGLASGTIPKRSEQRDIIRFNNQSLRQHLEDSKPGDYFLPDTTNYPFYDAFFYEQDDDNITLYILQMTSASDHRGSNQGYISIRNIVHFLQTGCHRRQKNAEPPKSKQLRMEVDVTIQYMLVCPFEKGTPSRHHNPSWQMPQGWDKSTKQIDVRGPAFLLAIPMDKD